MSTDDPVDKKDLVRAISEPSFASMRQAHADRLLLEIARCPVATECLAHAAANVACAPVVASQQATADTFQIPEPWSGDITKAFILFVSSNPSISKEEEYPRLAWPDSHIVDFFKNRFGGGRKIWVEDASRSLLRDGSYAGGTAFWRFVRNRAEELLCRVPVPGVDYALTEVVRCKSESETGVALAAKNCASRYLLRTIEASRAPVLVVLGAWARAEMCSLLNIDDKEAVQIHGPVNIGNRERLLAFLPHPNARLPRTFATFDEAGRKRLRDCIRDEE